MVHKLLIFVLMVLLAQIASADTIENARILTARLLCLILYIAPSVGVLLIIVSGFLYMSERRGEGKKMFYNTLLGLILVFLFIGISMKIVPDLGPKMTCVKNINASIIVGGMLCQILLIIQGISAGVALLVIIYSGIQWSMSGGNPEAIKAAKNHIICAVVGLIIVVVAGQFVKSIAFDTGISVIGCTKGS